jgi:hypothetical protein
LIEVEKSPFEVTETGWGEFEAQIRITFVPEAQEKVLIFNHRIQLHPWPLENLSIRPIPKLIKVPLSQLGSYSKKEEAGTEGVGTLTTGTSLTPTTTGTATVEKGRSLMILDEKEAGGVLRDGLVKEVEGLQDGMVEGGEESVLVESTEPQKPIITPVQ